LGIGAILLAFLALDPVKEGINALRGLFGR